MKWERHKVDEEKLTESGIKGLEAKEFLAKLKAIEEAQINLKSKNALNELLAALHAIYCDKEYNEQVFSLLEEHISGKKKKTGINATTLCFSIW